jgi:transposase-like protein
MIPSRSLRLRRVLREHCEIVLAMQEGRVREAARVLGVGFSTLYRWMAEWKQEDDGDGSGKLNGGRE